MSDTEDTSDALTGLGTARNETETAPCRSKPHKVDAPTLSSMSDLGPFVAAALRDKVVEDLNDEVKDLSQQVQRLEEELQPWTITISGPQGPPVYAVQNIGMRHVLDTVWSQNYGTTVNMIPIEGPAPCLLMTCLECEVSLQTANGKITQRIGAVAVGNQITRGDGPLTRGWRFYGDGVGLFLGIHIYVPVTGVQQSVLNSFHGGDITSLSLADMSSVVGHVPVHFRSVSYNAQQLVAMLR